MQTLVIEYARNVCGLDDADSTEFNPGTPHRVIFKLRELKGIDELGGTMRLGSWPCQLTPDSFAYQRVRHARDQRAPSPPLRVQSRIRRALEGRGPADHRRDARQHVRRDLRNRRPSLVPGLPVPSGIQVQADGAAPAVQGFHRRRLQAAHAAPRRRRRSRCSPVPIDVSPTLRIPASRWS